MVELKILYLMVLVVSGCGLGATFDDRDGKAVPFAIVFAACLISLAIQDRQRE